MTQEQAGLIRRLRDSCNCCPHNPCASQDECFDALAAADAIEAQSVEIQQLREVLQFVEAAFEWNAYHASTTKSKIMDKARDMIAESLNGNGDEK